MENPTPKRMCEIEKMPDVILTRFVGNRARPAEVVHLLLGPQANDLARVELGEAVDEAIVVFDVAVSVLELVQGGLEHLEDHLVWNWLLIQTMHTHKC